MDQVIERIKQLSNLSKYIMLYEKFDKKQFLHIFIFHDRYFIQKS